jgi:hypothetical protein
MSEKRMGKKILTALGRSLTFREPRPRPHFIFMTVILVVVMVVCMPMKGWSRVGAAAVGGGLGTEAAC